MHYPNIKPLILVIGLITSLTLKIFAQGPTTSLSNPSRLSSGGGGGAQVNTVNLNTGEVSFPVTLASIPGRNGLGAQVVVNYNSRGVRETANLDNISSPTGVLGLGWSLGMDQITSNHKNTTSRADDDFFINGVKLIKTGGTATVWEYKPINYQNWVVKFFINSDHWEVIKDDGTIYNYGINDNSLRYMIVWGDHVFQNLGRAEDQELFVLNWYLEEKRNVFGDRVSYLYRKNSKPVSESDKLFDQEVHLLEIEGNLGHKIIFGYDEKENTEFEDSHQESDVEPDAYQEFYSTLFLKSVAVLDGSHLLSYQDENGNELRNGTSNVYPIRTDEGCSYAVFGDGEIESDCYFKRHIRFNYSEINAGTTREKRILTKLQSYRDGVESSGPTEFEYFTTGEHVGVLHNQKSPSGQTIGYEFTELTIEGSDRDIVVSSPSADYSDPRIWHEDNYTVVTWYSDLDDEVWIQCYEWDGSWIQVINEATSHHNIRMTEGKQNFELETQPNYFALLTKDTDASGDQLLFIGYQLEDKKNQWDIEKIDLSTYVYDQFVTTPRFIAVSNKQYILKTYTKISNEWDVNTKFRESGHYYNIGAVNNTLVSHDNTDGEIRSYVLDNENNWSVTTIDSDIISDNPEDLKVESGSYSIAIQTSTNMEEGVRHIPRIVTRQFGSYDELWNFCEENPSICNNGDYSEIESIESYQEWYDKLVGNYRYRTRTRKYPYRLQFTDGGPTVPNSHVFTEIYNGTTLGGHGEYLEKIGSHYNENEVFDLNRDGDWNVSEDCRDNILDQEFQHIDQLRDFLWSCGSSNFPIADTYALFNTYELQYRIYEEGPGIQYDYYAYKLDGEGNLSAKKNVGSTILSAITYPDPETYMIARGDHIVYANTRDVYISTSTSGSTGWHEEKLYDFNGDFSNLSIGNNRLIFRNFEGTYTSYRWEVNKSVWEKNRSTRDAYI